MKKHSHQVVLRRQGYRPLSNTMWAKPFGFGVIVVDLDLNTIALQFKTVQDATATWNRRTLDVESENLAYDIRHFENFDATKTLPNASFDWGFLTQEEILAELL